MSMRGLSSGSLMRKSGYCLKTCGRIQEDRTALNEIKDAAHTNLSGVQRHFNLSAAIFIWRVLEMLYHIIG